MSNGDEMSAYIDGEKVFTASTGARIQTDLDGNILCVYGVSENEIDFSLNYNNKYLKQKLCANDCMDNF